VERVVSINGSIQVAGQKVQVGKVHARTLVSVSLDEHIVTVYDNDTPIKAVPRPQHHQLEPHQGLPRGHGRGGGNPDLLCRRVLLAD
jgi:hypothetical protein